jgi:hypothetical protein
VVTLGAGAAATAGRAAIETTVERVGAAAAERAAAERAAGRTLERAAVDGSERTLEELFAERQALARGFYESAGWDNIDLHLAGIDFSQPVEIVRLAQNSRLVQYGFPGRPTGNYFADVGTSTTEIGVNPAGRVPVIYTVNEEVSVLRSTAANTMHNTALPASARGTGGGIQYFIPNLTHIGH